MSDASTTTPTRTAPLALWRVAEAFLHTLYTMFGAPEDVAARPMFTAKAHAQLAAWLRCAEAMLRRLLLIEASAYPPPPHRACPELVEGRQHARKLMGFDAEAPQAWRVSFRVFTQTDRRLPAGKAVPPEQCSQAEAPCRLEAGGPRRFRSAWPLAERYEALIRVFNDPTASARRLARRLHATPHRLAEALRAPPEAGERVDHFEEFGHHAETAWRPHFSSA